MNGADPLWMQFLAAGMDTPCPHEWDGTCCDLCGQRRALLDALIDEGVTPADLRRREPDTSAWDAECEAANAGFDPVAWFNSDFGLGKP